MAIGISGMGSVSALGGSTSSKKWEHYQKGTHFLRLREEWFGEVDEDEEKATLVFKRLYPKADRTVLLALLASERALQQANWGQGSSYGINIGSSRGATQTWEEAHRSWIKKERVPPATSPSTTLGNISSYVGQHFQTDGPVFSHSITCSTALNAVANAVAWLESGRCNRFLAGGSEASLTDFTLAQMKVLRLYASASAQGFPCRAMDLSKAENTMVLGEGAAIFCLENNPGNPLAWLAGIGFATEKTPSLTGISPKGDCLFHSMQRALEDAGSPDIDVVITHSPGTVLGDKAEHEALKRIFDDGLPVLTNNKWMLGHTFGASGGISLEMGILMLQHQQLVSIPYLVPSRKTGPIRHILINAVGFGGNAVSLIIRRAE